MGSTNVSQDHLDFIPKIYDTMVNPDNWPYVLEEFAFHCGASGGGMAFFDNVYPEISSRIVSPLFTDVVDDEYDERFGAAEAEAFGVVKRFPAQTWVSDEEAFGIPADQIPCTIFQREACGIDRRIGACLNNTPIWLDGINLNYKLGRSNMTQEEAEVSRLFLPHIAKVHEINRPFALLKNRYQAILSVLDFLKIGLLIVNRSAEVVIKNLEAEKVLDANNGLALSRDNKFVLRSPKQKDHLNAQIIAAADTKNPAEFDAVLAIPKRKVGLPWLLEVIPMSSLHGEIDGAFRGAAIFITDPDREDVISTSGMQALFNLSPAESDICAMLAKGLKIEDVADSRNVKIETIRSQVKTLFAKTDSKSQVDLVRLALKVNLPVKRLE